jgi:hypothetical protein
MTYFFKCHRCLHEFTVSLNKPNDPLLKMLAKCRCGAECEVYAGEKKINLS